MQTSFTDLVGTVDVPAHCFDNDELTDLTPAVVTADGVDRMKPQASEALYTGPYHYHTACGPNC